MNQRAALITGINGMDGSHLADLLLDKGYEVHGIIRRHAHPSAALGNLRHILDRVTLHVADMTDQTSLLAAIKKVDPGEIYNLAAQSFVGSSWGIPRQTAEVNALGVCNLLEAARREASPLCRIYQASTSEMFGKQMVSYAHENTPFYPRSPYGVAKLYAHWMCVNYRESYGMHVNCGILFNHESERRGEEFVTQKIATGVAKIKLGLADHIELGNMEARRDWGYAPEYVEAMWLMLRQHEPSDFVIGTGEAHSVSDFFEEAVSAAGLHVPMDEFGYPNPYVYRKKNEKFMRPAEVDFLRADASKAKKYLGWEASTDFEDLVRTMVHEAECRLRETM
jgi:GDPmannose 4,6-dehydratase